jgi:hypothetical protein
MQYRVGSSVLVMICTKHQCTEKRISRSRAHLFCSYVSTLARSTIWCRYSIVSAPISVRLAVAISVRPLQETRVWMLRIMPWWTPRILGVVWMAAIICHPMCGAVWQRHSLWRENRSPRSVASFVSAGTVTVNQTTDKSYMASTYVT